MPYVICFIVCLCSFIPTLAQSDTLPDTELPQSIYPKYEVAVMPITFYYAPDCFDDLRRVTPVVGLQAKYFISPENAIRVWGAYSKVNHGTIAYDDLQQNNYQKTTQGGAGFQHTFWGNKKFSAYIFADFYYQNYMAHKSHDYGYSHNPPQGSYLYSTSDSIVLYAQQVNSLNVMGGLGIKILDRKRLFATFESGFGASCFWTATQHTHGTSTISVTDIYYGPNGVQQVMGPGYYSHYILPETITKIKGVNANACVLRISIGFRF
ncbi:MAG TPA: hypothetical protein VKG26_13850 [Bacteroidia bacterium]|nr:hypothetical protein [Bacteroidia bacterium]